MPNWEQIIDRFAARKPNPGKNNRVEWRATPSRSMHRDRDVVRAFCDETTLYSYGHHFTLAIHLGKDAEGRDVFLKNGDRNSPTTNKMGAHTQSRCYGPTVSMSALDAAGITDNLSLSNIVDWRPDTRTTLYRNKETGRFYRSWHYGDSAGADEIKRPSQGMWIPASFQQEGRPYEAGQWHVLGAALIRSNAGGHYLCSLDEGRYFVSKLATPAATVDEAFDGLKPIEVKEAEKNGVKPVRQGEWFFIPTGKDDRALAGELKTTQTGLRKLARRASLPRDRADSNVHEVMQVTTEDGRRYAKGKVFHRAAPWRSSERGPLTREHRTVNLGDTWHLACQNTQISAWSMGGNFD